MSEVILSRRDLEFLLYEWLDVEAMTARPRFSEHSRETFDAVLELSEEIATKHFAPHNKRSDAHEPTMRPDGTVEMIDEVGQALKIFAAASIIGGQFDEHLGGLQLPMVVARASMAWFQAANASTSSYPFLTIANANLLAEYGTQDQIKRWVRPMLEGRYFGTMCLSETGAGSSLADITTTAARRPDGTYGVTGTKMWISGGDHELSENIVHLVLAKIPGGPAGVKGISLILVPKFLPNGTRNDVTLVGLNHKMGNRGTTNTLLSFGDGTHLVDGHPGAVGYLVGQEHHGLFYMFHMMNEARIGVGFLATALGYAGYLQSVEYAKIRTQGRPVGSNDPTSNPVPLIQHADVRRMLLAQKAYVEGALALCLYCSNLSDERKTAETESARNQAALLMDLLTPIAKSWPAQWCLEANSLAIQVHGGYGYARDYDVEQLYRDNRLNQIHEGTHGIQGLDLLGRKVVMNDGLGLRLLVAKIQDSVNRAASGSAQLREHADSIAIATARLEEVTNSLLSASDPSVKLANSSIYLEAAGHVVVGWMWLEQLLAVGTKEGAFYDGKRMAAKYFVRYELPKTEAQFKLLENLDRTTLDIHPDWF